MKRDKVIDAFTYVADQYLDLVDSEMPKEKVIQMSIKKTYRSPRRVILIAATIVLLVAFATVAYANDLYGFRRTIQLWIHGIQTDVAWEVQDGEYHASYLDADGNTHEISGGGVAINEDGSERPETEEELLAHFDRPEVEYKENGTIWVYYHDQYIEITDRFDEDGVCYLKLEDNGQTQYLTIKYQGGFFCRADGYMPPEQFNINK